MEKGEDFELDGNTASSIDVGTSYQLEPIAIDLGASTSSLFDPYGMEPHPLEMETASVSSLVLRSFGLEVLEAHNECRKKHGAPPLRLDEQLSEQCQKCAEGILPLASVETSEFPTVGENICVLGTDSGDFTPPGEHPVNFWYEQEKFMVYGKDPYNHHSYNFSQMIWKRTELLGVGIARSGNKIVIVCHYVPPGNIVGEYAANVSPAETEADHDE